MYLKKIFLLFCFIGCIFLYSESAYAMPDDDEDFFEVFGIERDAVASEVEAGTIGVYTVDGGALMLQSETDLELSDINDYGTFSLTKGFKKLSVTTFSKSKSLSGKGIENTAVGVIAFNILEDGEFNIVDSSNIVLGASGVYSNSLSFATGDNNVIIAVKSKDAVLLRLFKITVKEEETKDILENMQIDSSGTDSNGGSDTNNSPLPDLTIIKE